MKVLDLHCHQGHVFEGWFASEEDFQSQLARTLIACPVCNSTQIHKGLSAPRLNLGATPVPSAQAAPASVAPTPIPSTPSDERLRALQAAWLQMSRQIAQQTEDVGADFADEARRIHRGEVEERGIRGQATAREALELLDEGIGVLPLALPDAAKEPLQ